MGRPRGKDTAGRVVPSELRGVPSWCLNCGRSYVPRVAEVICRTCVRSILRDPDRWIANLGA